MTDYPVLLRLRGRLCLVVGGGRVGRRKALGLLEAGARVRLVSIRNPENGEGLEGIEILERPFRGEDLEGCFLAFAATGDRRANAAVAREARRRGILVNVADEPGEGDFTLPARLRRGPLTIGVSTCGESPALAALVRDRLGMLFGPEWETVAEIAAALRQKRLTPGESSEYNQQVLRRLLDDDLPGLIARGDAPAIDRLLKALLGEEAALASLGLRLPKGTT